MKFVPYRFYEKLILHLSTLASTYLFDISINFLIEREPGIERTVRIGVFILWNSARKKVFFIQGYDYVQILKSFQSSCRGFGYDDVMLLCSLPSNPFQTFLWILKLYILILNFVKLLFHGSFYGICNLTMPSLTMANYI